jgi:hypothetical protein
MTVQEQEILDAIQRKLVRESQKNQLARFRVDSALESIRKANALLQSCANGLADVPEPKQDS